MKRIININRFVCLAVMLFITTPLYASVTLKISASNPSSFTERIVPVQTYLPKGISPDNVIDSSGLDVDWDEEREQTYVHKSVTLEAGASVSFEIEIDDIWIFSDKFLGELRDEAMALIAKLEPTEYKSKADELKSDINNYLEEIATTQDNALVSRVGPIEHIGAYEINQETIALIKESIKTLDQINRIANEEALNRQDALRQGKPLLERIHTEKIKKELLTIDETGKKSGCLVEITLEEEKNPIEFNAPETSFFNVVIENPSQLNSTIVPLRYYLTKEIKGRDVLDAGGLKIGFDLDRGLYYVHDKAIELEPAETKVFNISLRNRWSIDKRGLYASKIYIESMLRTSTNAGEEVGGTVRDYGEKATNLSIELLKRKEMAQLSGSQLDSFRKDEDKNLELQRLVREIEDLLMQSGISPADSLIEQEKYCVKARAEGLSKEEMEEGLRKSTILETQRIKAMAGMIFEGKSISGASIWRIISYIILFLGVISSVFYFVNIRQQKSTMFDPLTGAFSRSYILERLREEIKIAKGGNSTCSVLFMDIDKFKGINDTHGHAAGDLILKEFVIAMRKGIRATDLVGRFGGDEFVIILPTSEKKIAYKIASGIARGVESTVITVSPTVTLSITTSIGLATYPEDSGTADDMFDKADQALYVVKKRGGNGAEAYKGQA